MNDTRPDALTQEWVTLQNNHEQYERSALLVKLVAIAGFTIAALWPHGTAILPRALWAIVFFVQTILWLQEAILRTSQSRLGERLLRIEEQQRSASDASGNVFAGALQLHSEWQASRPGSIGLLGEYARNALRPTVAFPHLLLVASTALLAVLH